MDIKNFLESLSGTIDDDNIALYKKIIEEREVKTHDGSPEEFYFAVIYPFKKFLHGYISHELHKDNIFIYENYNFLDRYLSNLFNKHEGMVCSADKSRTIIKRLAKFHSTGEEITFNPMAEYTYHHPKTILTTHKEIMDIYTSLKQLFYGNPLPYMEIVSLPPFV